MSISSNFLLNESHSLALLKIWQILALCSLYGWTLHIRAWFDDQLLLLWTWLIKL